MVTAINWDRIVTEQGPFNTSPLPVKLRVGDYMLLDGAGAFDEYRKTELIDGEVLFMNAQHRAHARIKSRLFILVAERLRESRFGLEAIVEGSIAMPPENVPEPDIVVTSAAEGDGLIPLDSVRLVIEVSDSTFEHDLGRKAAMYARHGVPEYWVVDVNGSGIHQAWSSSADGYRERRVVEFGSMIAAETIEDFAINTSTV